MMMVVTPVSAARRRVWALLLLAVVDCSPFAQQRTQSFDTGKDVSTSARRTEPEKGYLLLERERAGIEKDFSWCSRP